MYEIIHTKRLFLKLFISTDDRRIIDSKVIFSIKKFAKVQKNILKCFENPSHWWRIVFLKQLHEVDVESSPRIVSLKQLSPPKPQ